MDVELVRRAQQGDDAAFASIAASCDAHLHAVAIRILRDPDLAADATQQALMSIWRDLPSLREPGRFDAWAHRVLVRICHVERALRAALEADARPAPRCMPVTRPVVSESRVSAV